MKPIYVTTALALALATPAFAQSQGEWTVGLGVASVQPKSSPGTLAGDLKTDIGSSARPTITVEYFVRDNLGVEVLAATPFSHEINIDGLGKVGSVKHLPPTISLNYHFDTNTAWKPFVGVGVNLTNFFSANATGALAGSDLSLKHSWGLAANLGTDYWLNDRSAIRANVRWIDIDSDVYLNGDKIGTVNIDPWVVGASYVMKF
ncbi:MAG: OmpW family outer membrane protein [Paracoccus sp. (in: a-proteobacteria)]|uniref:OmpW/AlkL family protein n=1 Tax=Paracoccus sp. TaxID=267 RepID=UPI0026DF954A|nr:OmpW family outer membrane protein [Paracoccus sp. (in: a-proteobacteria)]MDO5613939.1 OmpW family outer membrane protein [Paracoccus sp. (in: a-proteobacteria)]